MLFKFTTLDSTCPESESLCKKCEIITYRNKFFYGPGHTSNNSNTKKRNMQVALLSLTLREAFTDLEQGLSRGNRRKLKNMTELGTFPNHRFDFSAAVRVGLWTIGFIPLDKISSTTVSRYKRQWQCCIHSTERNFFRETRCLGLS